jgi:hypothetical protein
MLVDLCHEPVMRDEIRNQAMQALQPRRLVQLNFWTLRGVQARRNLRHAQLF